MDFAFLSSNLQIAYPFVETATVSRGVAGSGSINGLFASMTARLLGLTEDRLGLVNLRVRSSTAFPSIQSATATLRWIDSGSLISLNSADAGTTFSWHTYGTWIVFSWVTASMAIQFVVPASALTSDGSNEEFVVGYDGAYVPQTAETYEFDQSRVVDGPSRVNRVYVKQADQLHLVAEAGEDVIVKAGFNAQMSAGESTVVNGRRLTPIVIDAVPGAGQGQYLLCPGRKYLYTLNGVGPNKHGGAFLQPEQCYWGELPTTTPQPLPPEHGFTQSAQLLPNRLKLHNSCKPCCSCEDYVLAYNHARQVWDRAKDVAQRYQVLRDGYYQLLTSYDYAIGTTQLLTLVKFDASTIRVIVAYKHKAPDTHIKITLAFTLPGGVTLDYLENTGVFLSPETGLRIINPTDPDGTPIIELTLSVGEFQTNTTSIWAGLWSLTGIASSNVVSVEATVEDSVTENETRSITW